MNLFQEVEDKLCWRIKTLLEQSQASFEQQLTENWDDYVVVDGEEGDYGVVKLYDSSGGFVAEYVNEGGDSTFVNYTEYGKQVLKSHLDSVLSNFIVEVIEQL